MFYSHLTASAFEMYEDVFDYELSTWIYLRMSLWMKIMNVNTYVFVWIAEWINMYEGMNEWMNVWMNLCYLNTSGDAKIRQTKMKVLVVL